MAANPNSEHAVLKKAFAHLCAGEKLEDLGLTSAQIGMLRAFRMANSPGKTAYQISIEARLPSYLCAELKVVQRVARRNFKKKPVKVLEPSLEEVLKLRLQGLQWDQVRAAGANNSPCRKIGKFIACANAGQSLEQIAKNSRISEIEVKNLLKLLKENQKIKV